MDTKSEYNSQQNVDEKTSLLNYDVDAKLIDDEEINVRCFEADKKETEVDVVDAKLIKIDNSEGQHKGVPSIGRSFLNKDYIEVNKDSNQEESEGI
ncbi:hypothetical protein RhiirC2_786501 [Rhizophagus irregularis]|uniref:Uncharacterized protein n=1 Tax=Rhizophagus irregularis TaxID=588596 RepID=A0A2N1MU67_9GLOM|nr:hypothetical protein RhiirC2_786501 [Rhizophagus irregularis]